MRITTSEFQSALQFADYIEKHKHFTNEEKAEMLREIENIIPEGAVALQFKRIAAHVRRTLGERAEALAPATRVQPNPEEPVESIT